MKLIGGIKFEAGEQTNLKSQAREIAQKYRSKGYLVRIARTPKMMGGGYTVWVAKEKIDRYGRSYIRRGQT